MAVLTEVRVGWHVFLVAGVAISEAQVIKACGRAELCIDPEQRNFNWDALILPSKA